jgi:hypothetical protein
LDLRAGSVSARSCHGKDGKYGEKERRREKKREEEKRDDVRMLMLLTRYEYATTPVRCDPGSRHPTAMTNDN